MTPAARRRLAAVAIPLLGLALVAGEAARAQSPVPKPAANIPAAPRSEAGVRWQSLTPAQRQALAPLEREWSGIDATRKQKWITIADRYPTLPAQERARISERMTDWARLTPTERGQVRLRYQEARQVPAPDRSAKWQEYQNLPADRKQQLAARAASPGAASAPTGVRRSESSAARGLPTGRDAVQAKSNLVPNPALAQPPRAVAPTVVQAAPGATTRLMTRPVTPPPHQQSGMPKISATPEFVNRSTLLPRRGPQAAAVVTAPPAPAGAAGRDAGVPVPRPAQPAPAPARQVEPTPAR
jgi:hypothetical protein